MAERLAGGNAALALLGNTLPTGAMLVVLITIFGPISGAHLNPVVSLVFLIRGTLQRSAFLYYAGAQLLGAVIGVVIAHSMFDLPAVTLSSTMRTGAGQWLSELVATFGLIATILGTLHSRPSAVPYTVGLYITAAYWFTASTSFANPVVTVARALTDTFSGINPTGVPAFLIAEIAGALLATGFLSWLLRPRWPVTQAERRNNAPSE